MSLITTLMISHASQLWLACRRISLKPISNTLILLGQLPIEIILDSII
jgi:hypothetical protein